MHLSLTQDQAMIADSVRQLLAAAWPRERLRSCVDDPSHYDDSDLWAEIVRSEFHNFVAAGTAADQHATFMDMLPVVEQAGYALAPSSFTTSAVVAGSVLTRCQPSSLREKWVASDDRVCVIVLHDATIVRSGETMALSGRSRHVSDIEGAAAAIVVADDVVGVVALREANPAIVIEQVITVDATRRFAHIRFDGVAVQELSPVTSTPPSAMGEHVRRLQRFVTACDCLGGSQRALEMAVDYAKARQQFGRPIGSFQSLQHLMSDAYVAIESLRSACWYAAYSLEHETHDVEFAVLAASVLGTKAYLKASDLNVQTHGGMGFTKEVDAYLYAARAKVNEVKDGTLASRRREITHWLQSADLGPLVDYLGGHPGQIANSMSARDWYAEQAEGRHVGR